MTVSSGGGSHPRRSGGRQRVLVIGGGGMLGHKLCQVLGDRFEVHATFRKRAPEVAGIFEGVRAIENVDAGDLEGLTSLVRDLRPDAVVNAVGIVKQRLEAKDAITTIVANSLLPHHLAAACRQVASFLVQPSTDCVFSGHRGDYRETDTPDPVDLYGRSKLLGEVDDGSAITIRTSIIGRELANGRGLVEWFLAQSGGTVRGYANAIFSGLTTRALANIISHVIERRKPAGIWHVSSIPISKYDLLTALNEAFANDTKIERDEEFRCDRSLNSDRFWATTGLARPQWQDMVRALAHDTTTYRSIAGTKAP